MSNPFTTPFTCTTCGDEGMEIDAFPGPKCMACYSTSAEAQAPISAAELAGMFSGKAVLK